MLTRSCNLHLLAGFLSVTVSSVLQFPYLSNESNSTFLKEILWELNRLIYLKCYYNTYIYLFFLYPSMVFLRFIHVVTAAIFYCVCVLNIPLVNIPLFIHYLSIPCQWIGLFAALCFLLCLVDKMWKTLNGWSCWSLGYVNIGFTKPHNVSQSNCIIYMPTIRIPSPTSDIVKFLHFCHFQGCARLFHCSSNLHFPTNEDEHLLICFLVIHVFSLVRCLFMPSACFF